MIDLDPDEMWLGLPLSQALEAQCRFHGQLPDPTRRLARFDKQRRPTDRALVEPGVAVAGPAVGPRRPPLRQLRVAEDRHGRRWRFGRFRVGIFTFFGGECQLAFLNCSLKFNKWSFIH